MKTPLTPEERNRKRRGCLLNALVVLVTMVALGAIAYPVFEKAYLYQIVGDWEKDDLGEMEQWLSSGKDPDRYDLLHRAGSAAMADLLLKHGADPNGKDHVGNTPLHTAARWKSADLIRRLLEAGADPNRRNPAGQTPLEVAREAKNAEAIRVLQQAGRKAGGVG